jgi:hypothetical protein
MIDARGIATALHDGQEDKAGAPYIQHLRAVVGILLRRWPDAPERAVEAAWLHDSLEDTVATPESLRAVGVSSEAIALVQQLTRPSGMPYAEYIARLAADGDLWAIRIKLADNEHNSDPARRLPGSDLLERRYLPARRVLEAALAGRFPQPTRDENRETPPAPTRLHEGNGEQALPRAAVSGRNNTRRPTMTDLSPGDTIQNNDPRMHGRRMHVTGIRSCGTLPTLVECVGPTGRVHYIQMKRIHTDGKPRRSGFSLVTQEPK